MLINSIAISKIKKIKIIIKKLERNLNNYNNYGTKYSKKLYLIHKLVWDYDIFDSDPSNP
jgi:hypothetical protein